MGCVDQAQAQVTLGAPVFLFSYFVSCFLDTLHYVVPNSVRTRALAEKEGRGGEGGFKS